MRTDIINIQFKSHEPDMIEMQDLFNSIGPEALYMSHYDLAERTHTSPINWKKFITDSRVVSFFDNEMELLQRSKMMSMMRDMQDNKNTGQAQLLNTLLNKVKSSNKHEGPVFIYCYIPPNAQEVHAENVEVQDVDTFKTGD